MEKYLKYLVDKISKFGIFIIILSFVAPAFSTLTAHAENVDTSRNGDKYITNSTIKNNEIEEIKENSIMEINTEYQLLYDFSLPDNTFSKGDILEFSIPKEFQIIQDFQFKLNDGDEEVAQINAKGNPDLGYYIEMIFTTDYIETHSDVSGSFELLFTLNEKYVKTDQENTIILPDKEIIVNIPPEDDGDYGSGEGIGSGDLSKNKKEGEVVTGILPDNPNQTVSIFKWSIGLGKKTLLGRADSFEDIQHIYIEDEPSQQKLIPFEDFAPGWAGSFAFKGGFFTTLPWSYDGVTKEEMGLSQDSANSYYKSFKTDILGSVKEYDQYAQSKDSEFKQYKLEYYTRPINEVLEDTEFNNDATITIVYNSGEQDSWKLSESQMWNVGEGNINGRVAGVYFKKVDSVNQQGLSSAVFDLYKKNNQGAFNKIKTGITSNEEGIVSAQKLTTGDYYFMETHSPEGYQISNEKLEFSILTSDLDNNEINISKDLGTFKNEKQATELISVSGTKIWNDKNDQDGKRPDEITVNLLADGNKVADKKATAAENWEYTFSGLPKYKDGKEIIYTVTENEVPDYSTTVNGNNLTNSYTPGQTSVTVTKAWDDGNNQDGIRPNDIQVQLYGNDRAIGEPVTLNATNQWTHTWQGLDQKKNGKDITYTVKEVNVPKGYESSLNDDNQGNIIISNHYKPVVTEIKGKKSWDDKNNQDGKRPDEITVNLLADGEPVTAKKVTAAENWEYTFSDLPKYKEGKEIIYTVTENHIKDYSTEIKGNDIINHYTPGQTSATVTKAWDDGNNQDGLRPKDIQVQLYGNDQAVGEPVTLNVANQWTHTWSKLDQSQNGKDITYTVKEIDVPKDYLVTVKDKEIGNIQIINTHTPEKKPSIKEPQAKTPSNNSISKNSTSERDLPSTGEKQTNTLILLGMLLMVIAGAIYWTKKRKK